ncbi:putative nucleic acid-binding Zn-ribbon protein [Scopulibacillus daqui]|uniref:Nucleic acid-binding Zn-ribbon protein n=1 Tax=Scopulibacillus daqui TaxID=1469162 RepID=A0ABS2PYR9_9BACL|nr:hypothetical protein [Scopulibacillus daqui]MBM7644452.1 putative nucleic acid-binding Zn-ribbon protein [Scopulibacillus daqui]
MSEEILKLLQEMKQEMNSRFDNFENRLDKVEKELWANRNDIENFKEVVNKLNESQSQTYDLLLKVDEKVTEPIDSHNLIEGYGLMKRM